MRGVQSSLCRLATPQPQRLHAWHGGGLGGSRFARHYSGTGFASSGYMRCFSSPTYLPRKVGRPGWAWTGLPHSEMMGSRPDCGSSIVSLLVCVLHRLVVPRHPPTAHHVLPGHGVLGGRGQCPRHRWRWRSQSFLQTTKDDHKYSQTDELGKVRRSGNAKPCPLTCATAADPQRLAGDGRGLVGNPTHPALASQPVHAG